MNIFITIFAILVAIFALITACLTHYWNVKHPEEKKSYTAELAICLIALVLITFSSSFVIIPTGSTGVKSTFGQIDKHTLSAGFNWKLPFIQSVEEVNNKQQDINFETKIAAETNKRTTIYYDNITVTYQIGPTKSAWLFANVTDYKNLITNSLVSSAVKSTSKMLFDEDATSRAKIEPLIASYLQDSLNQKYGKDSVVINKVIVKDADFDSSYNKAIAAKQKAQLEAEKQDIENKKNIAKAEAEAKVKKTKANAEAEANKVLEKSLTPEILKQLYLDKWDGKLPTYMTGNNSNILFDVK